MFVSKVCLNFHQIVLLQIVFASEQGQDEQYFLYSFGGTTFVVKIN